MKNSAGSNNVQFRFDKTLDQLAEDCRQDPDTFEGLYRTVGVGKTWIRWFCSTYNLVDSFASWEKNRLTPAKWVFSMSNEMDLIRKNAKAQIKAINEQIRQLELAKDAVYERVLKQTGKHLKG